MGGSNQALEPGNVSVAAPYFISGKSGTIAAGLSATPPNSDVFSLRNIGRVNSAGVLNNVPIYVSQVRIGFAGNAAFTAGGFAFDAFKVAAFAAQATGGVQLTAVQRKTSGYPPIPATEVDGMIANTGALTAGTYTGSGVALSSPFSFATGLGGTLPGFEGVWRPEDLCPLILEANEGIVVRNAIAQAAGTGILYVVVDFLRQ